MGAGAIQELVLCGRAVAGHGQQPRLFAKRLGHFLEPGPPAAQGGHGCQVVAPEGGDEQAVRAGRKFGLPRPASLGVCEVIMASPWAASQPCQPNSCT